jgi:predicted DNA-binding transcriptional regulator AlpA
MDQLSLPHQLAAARLLGIGKTTLYRELKQRATAPKPADQEPRGGIGQ